MNCPNCHTPYEQDARFCPKCGQPLGNADYLPLSGGGKKEKGRSGKIFLIISVICIIIVIAGAIGYYAYIQTVKRKCRQATEDIFTVAHELSFSSVDPAYLPEELKENLDIRTLIQKKLREAFEEDSTAGTLSKYIEEIIDIDTICDDIVSSASYEIVSVDADYHSCRVTVRTENTDYSRVTASVYQELKRRLTDTDSLWQSIGSFFSSIFGEAEDAPDESDPTSDLKNQLADIYEKAKADTDRVSETGVIEYGIKDGSWTLIDFDEKLFYSYYGISSFFDK